MQISNERIEAFRVAYKEGYGEEISTADARAMAHRLLALYRLIMRPLPDESDPLPSQNSPAQSADAKF